MGLLLQWAIPSIDKIDLDLKLADFLEDNGWNIDRLKEVLPLNVVLRITTIFAMKSSSEDDTILWNGSSRGEFTAKSAYWVIASGNEAAIWDWDFNWKLSIPPKCQNFIWLLIKDRLLSNEARCTKRLANEPSCTYCNGSVENRQHIFRFCSTARRVWSQLNTYISRQVLNHNQINFEEWLKVNLTGGATILFAIALWHLWKWRCSSIFDDRFQYSWESTKQHFYKMWLDSRTGSGEEDSRTYYVKEVGWIAPNRGRSKLNIDGSVDLGSDKLSGGGLVRDDEGLWRIRFVVSLGIGAVLMAEIWAVYHGLMVEVKEGFKDLEVESDSMEAMRLIHGSTSNSHISPLIDAIRDLASSFCTISFSHVHKEQNITADRLAKHGLSTGQGCTKMTDLLDLVVPLLEEGTGQMWCYC